MAQPLHSFWLGPRLGALHVACLKSMRAVGHQVTLHVYDAPGDRPEDVPDGVTVADAAKVLPRSLAFTHPSNGLAMFSDLFRYALLRQQPRTWVDCDVFCLKPIPEAEYLFGWVKPGKRINTAILHLPPASPLLDDMWRAGSNPAFVPPWFKWRKRAKLHARRLIGRHHVSHLNDVAIGPEAFTYFAEARGLAHLAQTKETFYPISHSG
jgi:hypothetical protein